MNRRDVIRTLGGALVVAPSFARPQPAAGRFTIGMLGVTSPEQAVGTYGAFQARMRDLGYVEGRNISYEYRWAHGQLDRLPELAAELVALRVDVIVASYDPGIVAAKRATSTIPIVMTFASSPVEQGLIASLARPGGNITGLTIAAGTELRGQRLALLKAIVPGLSRVVLLGYVGDRDTFVAEHTAYAQKLGVSLDYVEIRNVNDIDNALSAIAGKRPDALVDAGLMTFTRAQQIADFALAQRLPCIGPAKLFAQTGYLLGLGVDLIDRFRRAATYVDKIPRAPSPVTCLVR